MLPSATHTWSSRARSSWTSRSTRRTARPRPARRRRVCPRVRCRQPGTAPVHRAATPAGTHAYLGHGAGHGRRGGNRGHRGVDGAPHVHGRGRGADHRLPGPRRRPKAREAKGRPTHARQAAETKVSGHPALPPHAASAARAYHAFASQALRALGTRCCSGVPANPNAATYTARRILLRRLSPRRAAARVAHLPSPRRAGIVWGQRQIAVRMTCRDSFARDPQLQLEKNISLSQNTFSGFLWAYQGPVQWQSPTPPRPAAPGHVGVAESARVAGGFT